MTDYVFKPVDRSVVENAFSQALFAASEQILTDCNTYIKHLEGALEDSSQHHVNGLTLELKWDTPYARRQWFTGKPSQTSLMFHPKASIMWAVKAENEYRNDWIKILEKGMNG